MIVSNSELLKSFSRYLKLEKGASDNTIDGYLHDVVKLFQYVSPESKPTIDQLVDADITQNKVFKANTESANVNTKNTTVLPNTFLHAVIAERL